MTEWEFHKFIMLVITGMRWILGKYILFREIELSYIMTVIFTRVVFANVWGGDFNSNDHFFLVYLCLRSYSWQNLMIFCIPVNWGYANFQKTAWMWIICIPRLRIKVWKFSEIITFLRPLAGRGCRWDLISPRFNCALTLIVAVRPLHSLT